MSNTPKRRWFRYSLRTLFVATTLVAICIAVGPATITVYKRRQLAATIKSRGGHFVLESAYRDLYPTPQPLSKMRSWLGDTPVLDIYMYISPTDDEYAEVRRYFPEARITPQYPYYSIRRLAPATNLPKRDRSPDQP